MLASIDWQALMATTGWQTLAGRNWLAGTGWQVLAGRYWLADNGLETLARAGRHCRQELLAGTV